MVAEPRILKEEAADRPLDCRRMLGVGDRVRLVHDVEEPVDGAARVEGHGEQEPDRLDREAQHRGGREVGEQLSEGQLLGRREGDAAQQRQRECCVGNEHEPEPDASDRLRLANLERAQHLGLVGELQQRVLAAAERLQHADAVHALFDGGRQVALLVLHAARNDRVLLLEDVAVYPDRNGGDEEEQAEPDAPVQQHDDADEDRDDVDDEQHEAE